MNLIKLALAVCVDHCRAIYKSIFDYADLCRGTHFLSFSTTTEGLLNLSTTQQRNNRNTSYFLARFTKFILFLGIEKFQ